MSFIIQDAASCKTDILRENPVCFASFDNLNPVLQFHGVDSNTNVKYEEGLGALLTSMTSDGCDVDVGGTELASH